MKPGNILIARDGTIQISDFGLARYHGNPEREMTKGVATRWYRPPEILYASAFYGEGVDLWALGCILAELLIRKPFFRADTDIEQLSKIFGIRGTPTVCYFPNNRHQIGQQQQIFQIISNSKLVNQFL